MNNLFDKKKRTLQGPAEYNPDAYKYYNDSARTDVGVVRKLLENWFATYPEDDKDELKSRFKVDFNPAFYELYVFVLFTSLGYSLEIHPEISDTLKHPDYLAKKDDERFYIEVKHMTMLSQLDLSLERRKNALFDALNKINASNFLLNLKEVTFKGNSQPSGKLIVKFFNKALSNYDPATYSADLQNFGYRGMQPITYEDDKVKIQVTLFPKSPSHRGENSRSIGTHPFVTQIGDDSSNIKGALETKASRYGHLNAPYIICINKQSISLDIIELQQALYGSLQTSWSDDPNNRDERLEFSGNGFFGTNKNPKSTRVSGVYLTNANPANLATTADHAFRHNPHAKHPVDLVIKQPLKEILKVSEGYPYSL